MISPMIIAIVMGLFFAAIVYLFIARDQGGSPYIRYTDMQKEDGYMKYVAQAARALGPSIPPRLLRKKPDARARLESRINKAGNPWKVTPMEFTVLKYTMLIGGIIMGFFIFWMVGDIVGSLIPWFVYPLFCGVFGFFIPDLQYKMSTDERDLAFKKQLPEALDMLVISTSAGSAFKQAMVEVVPLLQPGVVKDELTKVNQDVAAGNTIVGALENMSKRSPNADTEAFVKAIKQAEEYGSSADITQTLRARAETNREEYDAYVENKIAKMASHMMAVLAPTLIGALGILCLAPMLSLIATYGLF